jgi:hypothetical protein
MDTLDHDNTYRADTRISTGGAQQQPNATQLLLATLCFLLVLGGVAATIVLELRCIDAPAACALALGATIVLTVVGFVFLGRITGMISAETSADLLKAAARACSGS